MAKTGHVVYVDSDPTNVVGMFFQQNFPGGKTSEQAAADFAATLSGNAGPIASDTKEMSIDDYNLITSQTINL